MLGRSRQSYYDDDYQCKMNSAAVEKKKKITRHNNKLTSGVIMDQELMFLKGSQYIFHIIGGEKNKIQSEAYWAGKDLNHLRRPTSMNVRNSLFYTRCTIPKLELNIDHLINIDLLIPCCLFVCFFLHQDPSSLLKTSLPSIMYCFIYCRAAGRREVGYAPDKPSPYLTLSSDREKKQTKKCQQTCSCCCGFRTTNIFSSAL